MRLLTGPAGSGKTTFVLERVREALRAHDGAVRLLVPTATLARHLQNRLAREGFVFRRDLVETLSGFVNHWAAELPQVPDTTFYLIVEEAAQRVGRTEFARVVHTPGFCASLARVIEEFSSAGCDSARLAGCLPDAPLAAAFLAVYRQVDRELERRGVGLRARRLEHAAGRIEREGAGGIHTIWMDGFHALPEPELRLIAALGRQTELILTLGDADATDSLRSILASIGFREERVGEGRRAPALVVVRAPNIERECEEIARRILEQAAAGRPFLEMGVIVRSPGAYARVLESTLERFGIPACFYFDSDLSRHPVTRFLGGALEAMLHGWDHAETLAALRLAPHFAASDAMDHFDFAVREQIPNTGLGALKAFLVNGDGQPASPGSARVLRMLDAFGALEEWRSFALAPKDWAEQLRTLAALFRPAVDDPGSLSGLWRGQAAVMELFDEALDEAAGALDATRAIALADFWRAVKSVLRLKPLRLEDRRRNVVHVLTAHEARQWVLPVVFVCGMVEKHFPQAHAQDPFFPDESRRRLNAAGIGVRTAAGFEREERALFDAAVSRATMLATLSYPEYDARGDRNLPSIYLEGLPAAAGEWRPVRPRPRQTVEFPGTAQTIHAPALLRVLRERNARFSPTGLEAYLECPFRYFGGRTLRLRTVPRMPQERLDFMAQGEIVHRVLAEWWPARPDIAGVFERTFRRYVEEHRIPAGYRTERLRRTMLSDLQAFATGDAWPRSGFESRMEEPFALVLNSVEIDGKIDRLDCTPDGGAYVIDYKYSSAQRTRARLENGNLLQPPLYLLAAGQIFGLRPAGMFYVGMKGKVEYAGWSESGFMEGLPWPERWLETAAERTLRLVDEIRAGRIEPAPSDPAICATCDFRDVCRFEARCGLGPAGHA